MPSSSYPRYLLDTNVLVHYIRGNDLGESIEATYSLKSIPAVPLISAVTEGELRSLALQLHWGQDKCRKLESLAARFVTVQLDLPGIYDAYAEIDDFNRRNGLNIGKNDLWIAATAKVTRACLLTTDKDFDPLDPEHIVRELIEPSIGR